MFIIFQKICLVPNIWVGQYFSISFWDLWFFFGKSEDFRPKKKYKRTAPQGDKRWFVNKHAYTHTPIHACKHHLQERREKVGDGGVGEWWDEVNLTPPSSGRKCFVTSPSRMNFYGPCYVLSFFSSTFFWLVEFCSPRWSLTQQCDAAKLLLPSFE